LKSGAGHAQPGNAIFKIWSKKCPNIKTISQKSKIGRKKQLKSNHNVARQRYDWIKSGFLSILAPAPLLLCKSGAGHTQPGSTMIGKI